MISSGNFAPPWHTKYAGPLSGTGSNGVVALASPTLDSAGHAAGFASNVVSMHACLSASRFEGSCLGRFTFTLLMFAWLPNAALGYASLTFKLAPFLREVLPDVETLNAV